MKNLKLSKKLFLAFGSVLVLMVVIILVAVFGLQSVSGGLTTFYENSFQNTTYANSLMIQLNEASKNMLYACVTSDPAETRQRLNLASETFDKLDESVAYLKEHYKGDKNDVTSIENDIASVRSSFDSFRILCQANNIDGAFDIYKERIMPALINIDASTNTVLSGVADNAVSTYESGGRTSSITTILMIIVGILSLIAGAFMAMYITRLLVRCITELKNAALKMADGDFDVALNYESKDELGELSHNMKIMIGRLSDMIQDLTYILDAMATGDFSIHTKKEEAYVGNFHPLLVSIRQMNHNLSDAMRQINESADQVSAGSEQVSSGAQALSQGATEQASSVEELAATIDDISGQVQNNAQGADHARTTVNTVSQEVLNSNRQMDEMTKAMSDISSSAGEIGKIIATIENIAFQTNILALNAAVEAARAGTAGKGFAVVADEVRNLATKSSDASKNTAALIERALKAVDHGVSITDATAASLSKVVDGTQAILDQINEIAEASQTQASSIAQVTEGVDQISSVVQTNSATAEQSAAASEELSAQAQSLKDLVSRFKLKDSDNAMVSSIIEETALPEEYSPLSAEKY